jgi:hypothetical protein
MKTTRLIAIAWVALTLCCVRARAQGRDGNPGPVDVSVHSGVEERAQPEASPEAIKQPATFSRWSSQPAKRVPSIATWSGRMIPKKSLETAEGNKPTPVGEGHSAKQSGSTLWPERDRALDGTSNNLHSRTGSFAILPLQRPHTGSMLSLPVSPSPTEAQGFPKPFEPKYPGHLFDSFPTNRSEVKGAKARRFKSSRAKSGSLDPENLQDSPTLGKP